MLTNLSLPNGAVLAGTYVSPASTGTVFYLDSGSGSNGYDGLSQDRAFSTLDYAFSRCTANNGDVIVVAPGHAETTTNIGLDIAGVTVIGMGPGRSKPAFTATTAATDLFSVSAANISLYNLRLVGAASGNTALINTTTAGTDFSAYDCFLEPGAAPLNNVTINAARYTFKRCTWRSTANGSDNAILHEVGGITDWTVQDCVFNYGVGLGLDEAVIASGAFACEGGTFDNNIVIGFDVLICDFNSSVSAQGDGIISNVRAVAGAGVADIDTANDQGGYSTINCLVTDSVTESGAKTPLATPA